MFTKFIAKFFGRGRTQISRPKILAHRGARKVAPENTLAAFEKAVRLGFDGVEFDVVMTRDSIPVVYHGDDLSQTTRTKGLIYQMDADDVFKADAGEMFDLKYRGEKIPSLREALDFLSRTNMFINIELKSQPKRKSGVEKIVADMIHEHNLEARCLVSSFSPWILHRFCKYAPNITTSLLTGPKPFFFIKTFMWAHLLHIGGINPVIQSTTDTLMTFARAKNWKVFAWNVNMRQEYAKAIDFGVDGIITDEPELLNIK